MPRHAGFVNVFGCGTLGGMTIRWDGVCVFDMIEVSRLKITYS